MKKAMLAALAATAICGVGAAQAQDRVVEMRFGYWIPPAHALIPTSQAWADDIAKESNGTIKITIFPSEQLGKAIDHYDMSRDGIADIALVNPGYQPGRFPVVAAAELPFLFTNATTGSRAFDEWYRKYAEREMKDVKVCLGFVHDPGTFHFSKKKVATVADMKGMRVRPSNATISQYITLLGGTTVAVSVAEMGDVLEKGVVDGTAGTWNGHFLFKIEKLVHYHIDTPMYVANFVWTVNKARYNSMSANQKKIFDAHCTPEWAQKIATPWAEQEMGGKPKTVALSDHEVYPPTDLPAWKKVAEPLRDRWADSVKKAGYDPNAVMSELEGALKKYSAMF